MRRLSVPAALLLTPLLALAGLLVATSAAHALGSDPTVVLTKDRASYVAGQAERITATVSSAGSGRTLVISLLFPDGSSKSPSASNVDDSWSHTYSYTTYVNHRVRADLYDSDGKTVVATDTIDVAEVVHLSTGPQSGFLGHSGSYIVYAKGKSPTFRTYDDTGRVGKRCLRHQVQRRYASGWRGVFTSACRAEVGTHTDWTWRGKHTSRVKFRVRASFTGDVWNKAGHGAWRYFTFR
jgi:hypothetical protein